MNIFKFSKFAFNNNVTKSRFSILKKNSSKKLAVGLLGFLALFLYRKKGQSEEMNGIYFEKNLYRDITYSKLYKHNRDLENINVTLSQLNVFKENLKKKINALSNTKAINFIHEYEIVEDFIQNKSFNELNEDNMEKKEKSFVNKMNKYYKNFQNSYQIMKKTKSIKKECKKIDFLLRNISNLLDNYLFLIEKSDNLEQIQIKLNHKDMHIINTNTIIDILKEIESIKNNSIFGSYDNENCKNFRSKMEKEIFWNYIFNDSEERSLRLLSSLAIFKNFKLKNFQFSKENEEFALNLCRNIIHDNKLSKNESLIYQAKSFLINYLNKSDNPYFYSNYVLEINQFRNFSDFAKINANTELDNDSSSGKSYQKVNSVTFNNHKDDLIYKDFEYDIIFVCGLKANFARSWRIPQEMSFYTKKDVLDFYLKGKHFNKLFSNQNYQLWITRMLEAKTFKEKNIRYIVTEGETKWFKLEHMMNNIPDLTIPELSERIYKSLKFANVGAKPFILVCHSMGGLIAKNMIEIAEKNNDKDFLKKNRGIVFFSTPHLGSSVITSIISNTVNKYVKFINIINHTVADHGFENHAITLWLIMGLKIMI